jgi:hypothetical protein
MERSFQLLGVHLLFLLCASGFRARLASYFAWSLTRPPFVLQRRRIGTALSFSTPIESFERTQACRSGLQDSSLRAFTAPIAFHPGAELVQRHGAEHRDPLAEHLERHPHSTLAALAPDPWITFGLELGDSSVVCHPRIKARSSGQANPVVLRHLSLKIRRVLPLLAPIAALQSDHENLDRHFGTS